MNTCLINGLKGGCTAIVITRNHRIENEEVKRCTGTGYEWGEISSHCLSAVVREKEKENYQLYLPFPFLPAGGFFRFYCHLFNGQMNITEIFKNVIKRASSTIRPRCNRRVEF